MPERLRGFTRRYIKLFVCIFNFLLPLVVNKDVQINVTFTFAFLPVLSY